MITWISAVAAVVCLVYYVIIVLYAGFSTSFSWIWLAGAALLAMAGEAMNTGFTLGNSRYGFLWQEARSLALHWQFLWWWRFWSLWERPAVMNRTWIM